MRGAGGGGMGGVGLGRVRDRPNQPTSQQDNGVYVHAALDEPLETL